MTILTKVQKFWYFMVAAPFLLIGGFPVVRVLVFEITGRTLGLRDPYDGFIGLLPIFVIGVSLVISQIYSLNFSEIKWLNGDSNFESVCNKFARQEGWKIVECNKFRMVAKTATSLFTRGEHVTIVIQANTVWFNSISDPDGRLSIDLFGVNRRHLKKFRAYIYSLQK